MRVLCAQCPRCNMKHCSIQHETGSKQQANPHHLALVQTDLPLFVKIDNVPEEELVSSETFSRSTVWFMSQVCACPACCSVLYSYTRYTGSSLSRTSSGIVAPVTVVAALAVVPVVPVVPVVSVVPMVLVLLGVGAVQVVIRLVQFFLRYCVPGI